MESADWFRDKFPKVWIYLKMEKERIVKFELEDYKRMKDELTQDKG